MEREAKQIGIALVLASFCSVLAACTVLREKPERPRANGLVMNHPVHVAQGMDCSDCHTFDGGSEAVVAGHPTCAICHEIPEQQPTAESCGLCHTRDDFSVNSRLTWLSDELKFDHAVHLTAQVSCMECHTNLDRGGGRTQLTMDFCMRCHETSGDGHTGIKGSGMTPAEFSANDCAVCHSEIDLETRPTTRDGRRIAHDSMDVWMTVHGSESRVDPQYCTICHTNQEDCQTCHRVMKPDNHTPAWTRRIHGLQARFDRQSCAACHEEESCAQCHATTAPASHRGAFRRGMSTHCVQCHFPARDDCAICHDEAPHFSAPPSPHHGDFSMPPDCNRCHPGTIVGEVPHLVNLSTDCTTCHR